MTKDIIIIGAGIAGISLAAQLSKHCKVLVLEMEQQAGYHATGRSAAFHAPAYGNKTVRDITKAGEQFFFAPPVQFSEARLIRPREAVFIANQQQGQRLSEQLKHTPHLEEVNNRELLDRIPVIKSDKALRGALDTTGGDLDVDALLQGFLRQLKDNHGTVITGAKVTNIKKNNQVWHLHTSSGDFESAILVNAAGAWADNIAEMAGLQALGITPYRRTAVLVDAPSDVDITDWPMVIDVGESFYFKPEAGQLLISPADETASEACDAFPDELDIAIAIDRVQQVIDLEVTRINHSWAGLRSFAHDKTFVTGYDPRTEGFFWLAGQGGYGVQSAPGLSDIACYLITGSHMLLAEPDIQSYLMAISPERLMPLV